MENKEYAELQLHEDQMGYCPFCLEILYSYDCSFDNTNYVYSMTRHYDCGLTISTKNSVPLDKLYNFGELTFKVINKCTNSKPKTEHKCVCDKKSLLMNGCKCGGI